MSHEHSDIMNVAHRFAYILDRRQYAALEELLALECVYGVWGKEVKGASHIANEYRINTEWAFEIFNNIEFASEIMQESTSSAIITFTDRLHFRQQAHQYQCRQIINIDEHNKINRIQHIEMEGQRAALEAFFTQNKIKRPEGLSTSK